MLESHNGVSSPGAQNPELTRSNAAAIAALEHAARSHRSRVDRFVDAITRFCGRISFVYFHVAFFSAWIVLNTLLPRHLHFDPYPFEFLTVSVSLEAIFLSSILLISQNRSSELDTQRNELTLQLALLNEQENTRMLQMLEAIARKVGAPLGNDPNIAAPEISTGPELIDELEAARNNTR